MAFGTTNGLVVVDCRKFLAAISAHSASNGSEGPPLPLICPLIAAEPRDNALACNGGALRGLLED